MIDLERTVNHDGFVLWRQLKELTMDLLGKDVEEVKEWICLAKMWRKKRNGSVWQRWEGSKRMDLLGKDEKEVKEWLRLAKMRRKWKKSTRWQAMQHTFVNLLDKHFILFWHLYSSDKTAFKKKKNSLLFFFCAIKVTASNKPLSDSVSSVNLLAQNCVNLCHDQWIPG